MNKMDNTDRLLEIMELLRDPDRGCPWDIEQDFATIAPHTIEEAYEVADAVARGDMEALRDELGDLLLQVVFHAQMAREAGHFDYQDVAGAICDKLIRRHPNVFGDADVKTAAQQTVAWEDHKARERHGGAEARGPKHGVLDGVSIALPALMRAVKLQKRAARVGFDWDQASQVLDKIAEESDELAREMANLSASPGSGTGRLAEEMGDLLFSCVNLARKLDVDPETALRDGNVRFEGRFRRLEGWLAEQGRTPEDATLAELDALWERAKKET